MIHQLQECALVRTCEKNKFKQFYKTFSYGTQVVIQMIVGVFFPQSQRFTAITTLHHHLSKDTYVS